MSLIGSVHNKNKGALLHLMIWVHKHEKVKSRQLLTGLLRMPSWRQRIDSLTNLPASLIWISSGAWLDKNGEWIEWTFKISWDTMYDGLYREGLPKRDTYYRLEICEGWKRMRRVYGNCEQVDLSVCGRYVVSKGGRYVVGHEREVVSVWLVKIPAW